MGNCIICEKMIELVNEKKIDLKLFQELVDVNDIELYAANCEPKDMWYYQDEGKHYTINTYYRCPKCNRYFYVGLCLYGKPVIKEVSFEDAERNAQRLEWGKIGIYFNNFNKKDYYIVFLKALRYLFDKAGIDFWSKWMYKDIIEYVKDQSVSHHLSAYGGMGSINDIIICEENGHAINEDEVPWCNQILTYILGLSWWAAKKIEKEIEIDYEMICIEIDKYPESVEVQGWRCLDCGYGELSKESIDAYLTKDVLPELIKQAIKEEKIYELIDKCFELDIPNLQEKRNTVINIVKRSGITYGENCMRPCSNCGSNDTAVYRWKFKTKKKLLFGTEVLLVPSENNLKLNKR